MTEAAEQVPRPAVYCRQDRGNDQPILSELHHALDELLLHGKETIIDIKSLPFGSFDEQRLAAALGIGEVEAVVHALGESRITETAYPGIWWVEHRGEQGQIIAKFLEVAFVPGILKSQREDVAAAGRRLGAVVESQFREMQIGNESGVERE